MARDATVGARAYDTDDARAQYLEFHYAATYDDTFAGRVPPDVAVGAARGDDGTRDVVPFPRRCADALVDAFGARRGTSARALDVGCAVGGATLALARRRVDADDADEDGAFVFDEVVGFDRSETFVEAAMTMRDEGATEARVRTSGDAKTRIRLTLDADARGATMTTCAFEVGDACSLEYWRTLGTFDAVLVANVLCRLPRPRACLDGLESACNPGAVVVFCTPWSWLDEYTPDKSERLSAEELRSEMARRGFKERGVAYEMPCFIREHYRKAQYISSQVFTFVKQ